MTRSFQPEGFTDYWQFLTSSGAAEKLTDQLVSIIRQQRHLAARVVVATQEPSCGRFDRKNCHRDCDKNAGHVNSASAAGGARRDSSV